MSNDDHMSPGDRVLRYDSVSRDRVTRFEKGVRYEFVDPRKVEVGHTCNDVKSTMMSTIEDMATTTTNLDAIIVPMTTTRSDAPCMENGTKRNTTIVSRQKPKPVFGKFYHRNLLFC